MKRLVLVTCFTLVNLSSYAQVGPRDLTLAGMSDCIKDAISGSSVENSGDVIVFSCNAAKAKVLFNFLARKIRVEIVQDKNGKFENRQFGNNACYHRIEDPSGKPSDDFRCDLILTIGDALSE
jgi:hypothetical protein